MCFIDNEPPDVFEAAVRRARKRHRCYECGEPIEPGERYEHAAGKWDGEWLAFRTCARCLYLRRRIADVEESHGCRGGEAWCPFGELRESVPYYAENGVEWIDEAPPEFVATLAER